MEFISGVFSRHFRMGIPLHSKNVLCLLELWHGAILCIKIYPFCRNIMHSHESVFDSHYNGRHSRV